MKAAIVSRYDHAPSYAQFTAPVAGQGETLIQVKASALSQLVRAKASGKHYSSKAGFPFVPGVDGVGKLENGQRVYFAFPAFPFGAMAEQVVVKNTLWVALPDDVDDVTAAAIANPGMSSWAALTKRARFKAGETVLINGATGSSGQLAVGIARHMGASSIIVTGRNRAVLERLKEQGADLAIPLEGGALDLADVFRRHILEHEIDVVIDYLWGASAEHIIAAIAARPHKDGDKPTRFVQVGSISGGAIALSAAVLRSTGLEIMGSGLGSIPMADLVQSVGDLMAKVVSANLQIDTVAYSLAEVEKRWDEDTGNRRLVFQI